MYGLFWSIFHFWSLSKYFLNLVSGQLEVKTRYSHKEQFQSSKNPVLKPKCNFPIHKELKYYGFHSYATQLLKLAYNPFFRLDNP